jgi:hypothetical protein
MLLSGHSLIGRWNLLRGSLHLLLGLSGSGLAQFRVFDPRGARQRSGRLLAITWLGQATRRLTLCARRGTPGSAIGSVNWQLRC